MKKIIKIVGYLILVLVVFSVWSFWNMDGFKSVEPSFAGSCDVVPGMGSAEDIDIDREAGVLFISAADRLGKATGTSDGQGQILVLDINNLPQKYTISRQEGFDDFRPHGMSIFKAPTGERRLFIINHRAAEDTIELFDINPDNTLTHVRTIKDPLITNANDLAAVDMERFYVGNDSGATSGFEGGMEMMGVLSLSDIVYWDGNKATAVIDDFASAGGIDVSNDGKTVYINATSSKSVEVYDRDLLSGALSLKQSIKVGFAVDNADVAPDDSVWVAGHPIVMGLISHFTSGGEKPAPSKVIRLPANDDGTLGEPETIFVSTGEDLSASSVAVQYQDKFFMGGITPRKMLVCQRS